MADDLIFNLRLVATMAGEDRPGLGKTAAAAADRLESYEADMRLAAGEFLVPIPPPGTDAARMMAANAIMRRKVADLWSRVCDLKAERDRYRRIADAATNPHIRGIVSGHPTIFHPAIHEFNAAIEAATIEPDAQ